MKTIWDIHDQMGLKKHEHPKITMYKGTFSTGDFNAMGDYDAGILYVSISTAPCGKDEWHPFISISPIDDGGWHAMPPSSTSLEEANALVEKIVAAWEWPTKLPGEKELNDFLMPFGLWGEYTG